MILGTFMLHGLALMEMIERYIGHVDSAGIPGTAQKISTHPDNIDENDIFPIFILIMEGIHMCYVSF
ncbi:MAG: hypothetical protein PVF58_06750 [Candidatus Methanofastidiosia archaeon]|jgi:hypothetical protein